MQAALVARGYPVTVEAVYSGGKKGERILDAVGVPLAAGRVILLEDVVTAEDGQETIRQITHMTSDGRHLKHDDRIDSLAWALSAVAPQLLIAEHDGLVTNAELRLAELRSLGVREGGLLAEEEEVLFQIDDEETRLQAQLDRALAIRQDELRRGVIDSNFERHIAALRADLAKMQRWRIPTMHAVTGNTPTTERYTQ